MQPYRESTYKDMKIAVEFMDSLPIDDPSNALWWCLHQVVWHKEVDRVRWLLENKDLVAEIATHQNYPPDELRDKFWASLIKLKRLDR